MLSTLVIYGTGEGQTAKVADRIVDVFEARGHEATAVDAAERPADLDVESFDAVCVGASVHVGRHQRAVRDFVTAHREALAQRPTAFFQLSLSSAVTDEDRRAEAATYVDGFLESTGWHPDRIGLFGGALRYSKYGFVERLVMKQIAKGATGDTDTSHDYEYTDWHEVDAFAADFAAFVEARLGVTPPGDGSADAPNTNAPD
ncbi:flavodoxin domain-containing protein [Haloarchaeobius sp. HRN-SO-5]|uniref:flavodoxin domain-containing protein n=1 Tax=Haloarchaeobius sp. HRN-SO-5 TaxID=3446118 RepID=UPI003EBB5634